MSVIDTADTYGSGDCELLLGKVLRGRRQCFTLVTKAGYRYSNLAGPLRPFNQFLKKCIKYIGPSQLFTPAYLKKSIDDSLSRLDTDYVDAFLLHNPPLHIVNSEEVLCMLDSLQSAGKTRLTGVYSADGDVLKAATSSGRYGVIQLPASLKAAKKMLPVWQECISQGIQILGNNIFDPVGFGVEGMTHELLMRGSSALLPSNATILCGTHNPSHLRQSNEWACNPLPESEAHRLAMLLEI